MPNRLRLLIAIAYGAAVGLAALLWDDAVFPVAVVGAIVVGMVFVAFRPKPGEGRARNRVRDRDRG